MARVKPSMWKLPLRIDLKRTASNDRFGNSCGDRPQIALINSVPIVLVEFFVLVDQHYFGPTLASGRHYQGLCRCPALLHVGLAAGTPDLGVFRFGNKLVESKMKFLKDTGVFFSKCVHCWFRGYFEKGRAAPVAQALFPTPRRRSASQESRAFVPLLLRHGPLYNGW